MAHPFFTSGPAAGALALFGVLTSACPGGATNADGTTTDTIAAASSSEATDSAATAPTTSCGVPGCEDGDTTAAGSATDISGTTVEPTGAPSTETTSTTAPAGCVGDIVGNPACGGLQPYCLDGDCVDCGALDCAAVDPGKPVCALEIGLCVECLSDGDCINQGGSACDLDTLTCEACIDHTQCPDSACNLETGACFPKNNVLHVDTGGNPPTCSDVKPNWGTSAAEPLCTLARAMDLLVEGQPTTIKLNGSDTQTLPAVVPPGDYTVAIVPSGALSPNLMPALASPALTVSAGNTVFVHSIIFRNSVPISDPLLACDGGPTGARLWLNKSLFLSGRTSIRADDCQVHVHASRITDSNSGGIDMNGTDPALAGLSIVNSFVTANNGTTFGAIRLAGSVGADILYSTIALNKTVGAPIECTGGWSGELTIRNSALVDALPHFGPGCMAPSVITSLELDEDDPDQLGDVFYYFDYGAFLPTAKGLLWNVAVWQLGDPPTDVHGQPRPSEPGTKDYAGAVHR